MINKEVIVKTEYENRLIAYVDLLGFKDFIDTDDSKHSVDLV